MIEFLYVLQVKTMTIDLKQEKLSI